MEIILFVTLTILVIVLSGIISGSEAALLSTSYPEIKEYISNTKNKAKKSKARQLLKIKENLQKYITTIVILNNIVNIVGSMFIGLLSAKIFNNSAIVGLISGILTFLIILFAEIIPKVFGEKHSLNIAIKIAKPLTTITKILHILVILLNKLTDFFIDTSKTENQISEGVIKEMALMGKQEGSINPYESELINNVFDMDDTEVYDIMVPKNKVTSITKQTTFHEIAELTKQTGFTRFPVIEIDENNNEEVTGMINVKDLFKHFNKENFSVEKIQRNIEYIPETMKLSTLEKNLRLKKIHMAAIFNEHGEFSGIITLEDIFEELVGEIEDEFDKETKLIKKVNETTYIAEGSVEIPELNEFCGLDIDTEKDFATLNGLLIKELGIIPTVSHPPIIINKIRYKILQANKKQILSIEIKKFE